MSLALGSAGNTCFIASKRDPQNGVFSVARCSHLLRRNPVPGSEEGGGGVGPGRSGGGEVVPPPDLTGNKFAPRQTSGDGPSRLYLIENRRR